MTRVRTTAPGGLRVILCLRFHQKAPFSKVAEFKRTLISDERVLHSVDVSGSFDFMLESEHPNLAGYQEMIDDLSGRFGDLIDHYEANFICRRYLREEDGEPGHLWIPAASGLQRLEHARIDKITAEGDYVRVHSGRASWLLHTTMGKIFEELGSERFLQLSRSLIVRTDFIDRLMHDYRRWTARLVDGSEHKIAKSRSASVIGRLKTESSPGKAGSATTRTPTESESKATEKAVH